MNKMDVFNTITNNIDWPIVKKLFFLSLNQNMLCLLKRTVSVRLFFFEHPKQNILKLG